jgi:hypothetical protein
MTKFSGTPSQISSPLRELQRAIDLAEALPIEQLDDEELAWLRTWLNQLWTEVHALHRQLREDLEPRVGTDALTD